MKIAGFLRGADPRLGCDLPVLDAVSMVDVPLMAAVLKALPDHAALVLLGDAAADVGPISQATLMNRGFEQAAAFSLGRKKSMISGSGQYWRRNPAPQPF